MESLKDGSANSVQFTWTKSRANFYKTSTRRKTKQLRQTLRQSCHDAWASTQSLARWNNTRRNWAKLKASSLISIGFRKKSVAKPHSAPCLWPWLTRLVWLSRRCLSWTLQSWLGSSGRFIRATAETLSTTMTYMGRTLHKWCLFSWRKEGFSISQIWISLIYFRSW